MAVHYDALSANRNIKLDLPLREGVGIITQDVAKPHHPVSLVNTPSWTILDSYLGCLTLNGTNEYLQSLNADTPDLAPGSGDYSIGGWFFWQAGDSSQVLIGRYQVDVGGWELYLYDDGVNYYMTLRHHHSAGATTRTACYSGPWQKNMWHFVGISRSGIAATFHQGDINNGVSILPANCSAGGLIDPEATTSDLVIGARYTKSADFHTGMFWRWRYWCDRALTLDDWKWIWEHEVEWFRS